VSKVIEVENLSKMYRLGSVDGSSLRDDLDHLWNRLQGKNAHETISAEENDRSMSGTSDYVWSLKDIHFSVEQGEVLGIIGKNGAGKSTLLKLLSKVTAPNTGSIRMRGRVASLLEVGTGFHPELTGRENIYLNGAILGMRKNEIKAKFDEIVAFAGVERYIDTPVKRYSSGMYVRLAFAVAAHLEPEILIVDEVLAVGDAEFQKKCLGKMRDVSSGGRTILFVSHNLEAIKNLCSRVVYLSKGTTAGIGTTEEMINLYNKHENQILLKNILRIENQVVSRIEGEINEKLNDLSFNFVIDFNVLLSVRLNFIIRTISGIVVCENPSAPFQPNKKQLVDFTIPSNLLNNGIYALQINILDENFKVLFYTEEFLVFEGGNINALSSYFHQSTQGILNHSLTNIKILS
jgi:lipopolysaccharide transport system ATP-binding protein